MKSIRVTILDREYPLKVSDENEERTREIAAGVDERMQLIRRQLAKEPDLTVAIMAALSFSEECDRLKQASSQEKDSTAVDVQAMIDALANVVK